ncbi:hypothetical protein E4P41_16225 [Geodermatophilus sp. DF01-2]|uniref:uracil-xanthine permease family protein n=1 Tax=Geodermatophilus sp. DF01-2 TaxID=2559610 RepID=UPI0010742B55|nr:solute carrier family 23 protein [Geodermatophilus sp. DF01_2]TFV56072.1 hypothetical protein E4P41_16225 [Geodermatophilus sp. DF01_2]
MKANSPTVLKVGFDEKLPAARTGLFGLQHLLALTGIWIFPVLIGQALELTQVEVSYIVQGCFLLTGLVTILQSSRLLKLPIVQGPTAVFFVAIVASGAAFGLGTAFGSMVVAGLISMALAIPIKKFGLFGQLARFSSSPIVFGTLFVIIGAQLATIGLSGWFGVPGTPGYGALSFWISVLTVLAVLAFMIFGGQSVLKRGAIVWGIAVGTIAAAMAGIWSPSFAEGVSVISAPQPLPFGFGVQWSVVLLMLLAFLQAGAESAGMYSLVGSWGAEKVSLERTNRGLFTEFLGTSVGALFGGIGTTSYPENAGIVRVSGVGSRFVTAAAGVAALVLAFIPPVGLFIAGLPSPVLAAASTILFGVIAMSGVQLLADVEWDDLNMAVAAPSFIISLGLLFLPEDLTEGLSPAWATVVDNPMMVGIVMLIVLHILINVLIRPLVGRRRGRDDESADLDRIVDPGITAT